MHTADSLRAQARTWPADLAHRALLDEKREKHWAITHRDLLGGYNNVLAMALRQTGFPALVGLPVAALRSSFDTPLGGRRGAVLASGRGFPERPPQVRVVDAP